MEQLLSSWVTFVRHNVFSATAEASISQQTQENETVLSSNNAVVKNKDDSVPKNKPSLITMEEVEKHDSDTDCWMVIDGKVYDVSDYIFDHPGGAIICDYAGKDATEAFDEIGHSDQAYQDLDDFYIGELAD
eukprot:gb/GECH01013528.1/.p1 GENE.gb/GECH01013528.1/~~gb/GECH01013528.1/.p1  ORF type:complete len:132 (+),score=26.58 gb/GECH01013528.1/:1-396(+)